MTKVNKTPKNPHGLTGKEFLVVEDLVNKVVKGKPLNPTGSIKKFYEATDASAQVMASNKMRDPDFRAALVEGLQRRNILGNNSLIEEKLSEGLYAQDRDGGTDYGTVLDYIKEINKVAGVYAPERKETKTLKLNVDISQEELDKRIKDLQKELAE